MMWNLYHRRLQMLPVVTEHFLFSGRLNISGQQNTLMPVIDLNHAGVVIPQIFISTHGPMRTKG